MSILDAPGLNKNVEDSRRWAWSFGVRGVKPRFPAMTQPPTITRGGNASSVNASYVNGNTLIKADSTVLQHLGSIFVDTTLAGGFPAKIPSHITDSAGVKGAGQAPIRIRFQTDAPAFDVCFLDVAFSQFNVLVDGEYAYRSKAVTFTNSGNYRYYKVDFGADVITYSKSQTNFAITAAGTGYAVGDNITLNGGTGGAGGTPCVVVVTQITGSTVAGVDIVSPGAYTTQPTGTFSQASTTGGGSGVTLTAQFFNKNHSTRKMRRIELVYQTPCKFLGIVGTTTDVFLPWSQDTVRTPKFCVIGDSIQIGTYLEYGGAHIGCSLAQSLGLWDKLAINGIGGTGWITGGNSAWSHPSRVADFIAHQADIYVIIGSQNDGTPSPALQSAVTATLNQILNGVPNCKIVGIGNVLGSSTALAASIEAGYLGAQYQNRVRFINNQSPDQWLGNFTSPSWTVTNDGNHLNQEGQDYFAKLAAPYIGKALVDMIG